MRISDWSSDVCSSDLQSGAEFLVVRRSLARRFEHRHVADARHHHDLRVRQRTMQDLGAGRIKHAIFLAPDNQRRRRQSHHVLLQMRYFGGEVAEDARMQVVVMRRGDRQFMRSEEHTSELQSLMRISYAVFCLKKTQ